MKEGLYRPEEDKTLRALQEFTPSGDFGADVRKYLELTGRESEAEAILAQSDKKLYEKLKNWRDAVAPFAKDQSFDTVGERSRLAHQAEFAALNIIIKHYALDFEKTNES